MIVGDSKKKVILNIRKSIEENNLNQKVEVGDPILSLEEKSELLDRFYKQKKSVGYKSKQLKANLLIKGASAKIDKDIEIVNIDALKDLDLSRGAFITCNHFNPLDSINIRKIAKILKKKLYIVIQDTNLALPGDLGLLMNYTNTIPLSKSPNYIINTFIPEVKRILDEGDLILIYPEEEMWFNYRKPRPCKRGVYQFASMLKRPIISCFVEQVPTDIVDNEEFNLVKYRVHILNTLEAMEGISDRENSKILAMMDYEQKVTKYEEIYKEKLDYKFSYRDIVGYRIKE